MARELQGSSVRMMKTLFHGGGTGGLTDDQLLDRFLDRRDEAAEVAFEVLVARHGPLVLDVCRSSLRGVQDVEDAFQATFMVLACKAASIRRRDSLASWLFRVARRVAARTRSDAVRRRAHERQAVEMAMTAPQPTREPEDVSILIEEIEKLPAKYREPVIRCYLQGVTYEAERGHGN